MRMLLRVRVLVLMQKPKEQTKGSKEACVPSAAAAFLAAARPDRLLGMSAVCLVVDSPPRLRGSLRVRAEAANAPRRDDSEGCP